MKQEANPAPSTFTGLNGTGQKPQQTEKLKDRYNSMNYNISRACNKIKELKQIVSNIDPKKKQKLSEYELTRFGF